MLDISDSQLEQQNVPFFKNANSALAPTQRSIGINFTFFKIQFQPESKDTRAQLH